MLDVSHLEPSIPSQGVVAYYPFNGNANDESGNENNGTVKGVTNLTTDAQGTPQKAYSFSGGNGDYIEVPDNPQLALHDRNSTIALWFKFDGGVRTCDLIGQSDGGGAYGKWMIHCMPGGHLGEKIYLHFNGSVGEKWLAGVPYSDDGNWHHLLFKK